jgi:hypothetical protein
VTAGWQLDRTGTALRGENPTVLRRLDAGFANIGDVQFLRTQLTAEIDRLRRPDRS